MLLEQRRNRTWKLAIAATIGTTLMNVIFDVVSGW